jgi:NAD(P)-dependent dehydrogenase (short-subunit alcohol dehydrogenase family)
MRNPADGDDLDGIRVERLDVNDPETIDLPPGLRVLVNNAGVESENLPLEFMPEDAWRNIFETNVFGLVAVTKRAVPLMRAAGGGVICNITSSSMLAPVPFLGTYRASKAAVSALGETLAAELAQFRIRVIEVMPGPIETDMLATSDKPAAAIEHEEYRRLAERMWEGRQQVRASYTPAAEAARRIVDAICADDGPLRYGCDDLSSGMLDGWNATNNAQWVGGMLKCSRKPRDLDAARQHFVLGDGVAEPLIHLDRRGVGPAGTHHESLGIGLGTVHGFDQFGTDAATEVLGMHGDAVDVDRFADACVSDDCGQTRAVERPEHRQIENANRFGRFMQRRDAIDTGELRLDRVGSALHVSNRGRSLRIALVDLDRAAVHSGNSSSIS